MPNQRHSVELKLLHGVDPNERVDVSPKPARREPLRPAGLTIPERRMWDEVVDELREMGTLTSADTYEILGYVRLLALAERVHNELVKATALTTVSDIGAVRVNPLITSLNAITARCHQIAYGLGLTPHGRSVINGRAAVAADTEAANTSVRDLYA